MDIKRTLTFEVSVTSTVVCNIVPPKAKPVVAPSGARAPFFGTNPMAFSWPRKNKNPMVFDQASAAMARGEIMIAARESHKLPQGVGIDKYGKNTRNMA